jgi:hypothetical protein
MELHLVPDTNLFFEFKALEQLPWVELGHDPIVLLLTKPVLDEIDKHKKAGGRTRERAIDIYSRFRGMLEAGIAEAEIQGSGPKVVLRRATSVLPDPELKEHLDYDKADEKLIGIVSTLSKQASGTDVKLFTDDGGPAGMALDLGVPFKMIPQPWRRPPAETTEAKELREVKKDLATYRNSEPKIVIRCETADASGLVKVVGKTAAPLTDGEVEELIETLRLKHPQRDDFTPPETKTTIDVWGATKTVTYSAPADDDITNYRDHLYPRWLDDCRAALRRVHVGRDEEAPPVTLRWAMSNDGSRPAERVRIEFATEGHLSIQRPRPERDDDEGADGKSRATSPEAVRSLPSVPRPPAFGETVTVKQPVMPTPSNHAASGVPLSSLRGMDHLLGKHAVSSALDRFAIGGMAGDPAYDAMRRMHDVFVGAAQHDALMRAAMNPGLPSIVDRLATPVVMPIADFSPARFRPPSPPDPEEFFYASWPHMKPVQAGALTCQLWRHRTDDEIFEFIVLFDKVGDARGVVECTVHADNITVPPQKKVIVKRKIEIVSVFDVAKAMVAACD